MAKKREKYTEHPSMIVVNGTPHLRVLEDFFIEEHLPKWRKIKLRIDEEDMARGNRDIDISSVSSNMLDTGSVNDRRSERELLRQAKSDRINYVNRRRDISSIRGAVENAEKPKKKGSRLKSLFSRMIHSREDEGTPVEEVFQEVKESFAYPTNEDILRAQKVIDTIKDQLKMAGQYEIAERIDRNRDVLKAETALVSAGRLKYITEEQIVKLMLKSERGMRVEYLRYFPNILPAEVAQAKIASDALLVFDNYCVLYYDNGTPKFDIVKEVADDNARLKNRDPILFGMIKGSRKLYYVADWVTNDDDITLEKLEGIIGEKALDLGNDDFGGTEIAIGRMLDRVVVDIESTVEEERRMGTLITDENIMHFLETGEVSEGLRPKMEAATGKKAKNKMKRRGKRH